MFSKLRFRLIDVLRRTNSLAILRELEAIQYEAPASINERMLRLKDRYFSALKKGAPLFKPYGQFDELPFIDKTYANAHRHSLENPSFSGKRFRKKTGGSTGEPFVYSTGSASQSCLWASILLSWRVAGYKVGEPVAFLAGTALFGTGFRQRAYYWLMNATLLSAFDMSDARMGEYAAAIASKKARILYGYASAIHRLALYLLACPSHPEFTLRGVICTAEALTETMRSDIEAAFGAPCFSQYGCNDAGVSAFECEHKRGFHLITTRCYPEVLEGGRFIATDLLNDAFFLPRYDTGDLVEMSTEPCPCGRGFPVIARVVGRNNDFVVDTCGHACHSEFFTHMFREDSHISAYQIVFNSRDLVVNLHTKADGGDWSGYTKRISESLNFDSVRFVENMPFQLATNGKRRFVVSTDRELGELFNPLPMATCSR